MNPYEYLKEIRYVFYTKKIPKKVFVLGNSTCDVDSALSAYLLSIGQNIRRKVIIIDESNTVRFNYEAGEIYVPVLNCPRGEFKSRLDGKYIFDKFHINDEDFFYIDDQELKEEHFKNDSDKNYVILVDHSELDVRQKYLSNYVIEVFDHHLCLKLDYPNLQRKFIKYPLGSCTTLILIEFFLTRFPHCIISPLMALSGILIDTENFKEELKDNRWSELDRMIYHHIMEQIQANVDINAYYKAIHDAKGNVENNLALGLKRIFEKDRKSFTWNKFIVLWSSLQIPFQTCINHFKMKSIREYITSTFKGNFYVINSQIDEITRSFSVLSFNNFEGIDLEKMEKHLKENLGKSYKKFEYSKENSMITILLDNKASRKSVEPVLRNFFINI